jgi:hypothetical protein
MHRSPPRICSEKGVRSRDFDLDIDANRVLSVVASPRNQFQKGPASGPFYFLSA